MEQKTIGSFIATLRKANGLTQKQLAEKLGVSDKTISHWERDESAPDLSIIPILADIFGVTCDELLRGEKRNSQTQTPEDNTFSKKSEKQISYLSDKALSVHTVLSVVGSAVSVIGLILFIVLYINARIYIGFAISSVIFIASAVLLWLSNYSLVQKFKGEEFETEKVKETIKKANSVTFYFFTVLAVCFGAALGLTVRFSIPIDALYFIPLFVLVCAFFLDLFLKQKDIIFSKLNKKQIKRFFKLRVFTVILAVIIFSLPLISAAVVENYSSRYYSHCEMHFSRIEDFKNFMETEKKKPEGADEIDINYYFDPEIEKGLVRKEVKGKNAVIHLYDDECNVKKDVEFTWNNEDVMGIKIHDYFSEENEERDEYNEVDITVVRYSPIIKYEKSGPIRDMIGMISLVYYPVFAVIFVAVYFLRSKKIRAEK